MNKNFMPLLTICLACASTAIADRLPQTRTFEALAATVRMPVSNNGTISLRECGRCEYESIRVTPETKYRFNNQTMRLEQFLRVVQRLKLGGDHTINVTRDEKSQTVVLVFATAKNETSGS